MAEKFTTTLQNIPSLGRPSTVCVIVEEPDGTFKNVGYDSPMPVLGLEHEMSKGNIPGHAVVIIRGHNLDIDSGVEEDVWEAGGLLARLDTAETMNLAGGTNDDAGAVGTGAWTVRLTGLDDNWLPITEDVTLDGTTPVETTLAFLRINDLRVLTAGTALHNVDIITATASSAGTVQSQIGATDAIAFSAHYATSAIHYLHAVRLEFNAIKAAGGEADLVFSAYVKDATVANSPWLKPFDYTFNTAHSSELSLDLIVAEVMPPCSDIRIAATSDRADTEVRVRLYGILTE